MSKELVAFMSDRSRVPVSDGYLTVYGPGPGRHRRLRLLLQGIGCVGDVIWSDVVAGLAACGDVTPTAAFDPRGIGRSTGAPTTVTESVEDVARVIASLGASEVQLVGHSLGGLISLLVSERYPRLVHSVALIATTPRFSDRARAGLLWRAQTVRHAQCVASIFDSILPKAFCPWTKTHRPEVVHRFQAMLASQVPSHYAAVCEGAADADATAAVRSVRCRTLVIAGSDDVSTPPTDMLELARNLRDTAFVAIPRAGHNPPLEQPARVAAAIAGRARGQTDDLLRSRDLH
jgi:pimeloyl-ACP methyl ester carboxylesterase